MPLETIYQTTISETELKILRSFHADQSRVYHDKFMAGDEAAQAKSQFHFDRWQHLLALSPI